MSTLPLFRAYPSLAGRLSYRPLGDLPTPVEARPDLAEDGAQLYVKRDDVSGRPYGGNKVRKLAFLLGQAAADGRRAVITGGYAGSNHVLATAIYARALGIDTIGLLLPQAPAPYVAANLRWGLSTGARLALYPSSRGLTMGGLGHFLRRWRRDGRAPMIIPGGGSSSLGCLGYVNAAFELRDQIAAGQLPAPDAVYTPFGSMGTAVGLALGLAAAGLPTRVVAVRTTERRYADAPAARRLLRRTVALLRRQGADVPDAATALARLSVRHDHFGDGYAHSTPASRAATERAADRGLALDPAYTAKTFAALRADAAGGRLAGQVALFWHTYNSQPLPDGLDDVDISRAPVALRPYLAANRLEVAYGR